MRSDDGIRFQVEPVKNGWLVHFGSPDVGQKGTTLVGTSPEEMKEALSAELETLVDNILGLNGIPIPY